MFGHIGNILCLYRPNDLPTEKKQVQQRRKSHIGSFERKLQQVTSWYLRSVIIVKARQRGIVLASSEEFIDCVLDDILYQVTEWYN